jgi:hypothetical protein
MIKQKWVAILIVFVLLGLLLSCNIVPQKVRELFVSATPTSTKTPTPLPTSTSTPTNTATPPSVITMTACPFLNECPGVEDISVYNNDDLPVAETVTIKVPYDRPVRINVGWPAMDQEHLDEDIPHIKFYFRIDGKEVDATPFVESGLWYSSADSQTDLLEYDLGIVLSGWKVGEIHLLEYGYIQDAVLSDGWQIWQPLTMDYTIVVIPVDQLEVTPTLEPSSTPTPIVFTPKPVVNTPKPVVNTPKPVVFTPKPVVYTPKPVVNTPRPTVEEPTKAPTEVPTEEQSCSADSQISISNTTGSSVKLILTGPTKYTFNLDTGDTTLNVCSGSYSYSAYGCGGAYDQGNIDSGTSHEFYCTSY